MKAFVYEKYGAPDVLELREIEKPTPDDGEVLIKVHASTVTPVDCIFRQGGQLMPRLYTGITRPKNTVLGTELAGEIEAVGKNVSRFKPGQHIFASTDGHGAHAEYVCISEDGVLAEKPQNMTFEESAAICNGALTALPFLRDLGNLQRGQKVLINGASGSIGTFAIQLAKYFGADVTGVCSGENVDLVKSLGADTVIDYTREDFTSREQFYDIIFDTVGKRSFSQCKRVLAVNGVYLSPILNVTIMLQMLWTSMFGGKKARFAATGMRPPGEQVKDMAFIRGLIEEGRLKTVVDKRYPLAQMVEAHAYVDEGHKKGNVVVIVG